MREVLLYLITLRTESAGTVTSFLTNPEPESKINIEERPE
jgi:hypothetical protein